MIIIINWPTLDLVITVATFLSGSSCIFCNWLLQSASYQPAHATLIASDSVAYIVAIIVSIVSEFLTSKWSISFVISWSTFVSSTLRLCKFISALSVNIEINHFRHSEIVKSQKRRFAHTYNESLIKISQLSEREICIWMLKNVMKKKKKKEWSQNICRNVKELPRSFITNSMTSISLQVLLLL